MFSPKRPVLKLLAKARCRSPRISSEKCHRSFSSRNDQPGDNDDGSGKRSDTSLLIDQQFLLAQLRNLDLATPAVDMESINQGEFELGKPNSEAESSHVVNSRLVRPRAEYQIAHCIEEDDDGGALLRWDQCWSKVDKYADDPLH